MRPAILAFTLIAGSILHAQQPTPAITHDTPASTEQLLQWLHSGDPRLVAWSATLARERNDQAALKEAANIFGNLPAPPLNSYGYTNTNAEAAILDGLIARNVALGPDTIDRFSERFPTQAAILASRLPPADAARLLARWYAYGKDNGTWERRELARVASMMLARDPSPEFVTSILADSAQTLEIDVYNTTNHGRAVGGTGACGDGIGGGVAEGWPDISTYSLAEYDPGGETLIQLASDRISWTRHSIFAGWGSCYFVQKLNDITRHRLLAFWLHLDPRDMPWQPTQIVPIVFTTEAIYLQELGATVEKQRHILSQTAAEIRKRTQVPENRFPPFAPHINSSFAAPKNPARSLIPPDL